MLRFMESCRSPIRTLPVLRSDPNNVDDVDTDGDDHDWDMTMYGCLEVPIALPVDDDGGDFGPEPDVVITGRGGRRAGLGDGPWTR